MARSILIGTGSAWLLAGIAGLGLAAVGADDLERLLPPLVIDTDALRAAILSFAVGLLLVGGLHALIVLGLGTGRRLAWTAGILMSGVLCATSIALAASAGTSAIADPDRAVQYVAGAVGGAFAALAYGVAVARLVSELRSRSAG